MKNVLQLPASFKDPSGFIFQFNGPYYRQVNESYATNYDLLMSSGLYSLLTKNKWLIPHTEINENISGLPDWYKTLYPEQLSFTSYPYEWCFDQLKDAALLTLNIVKSAVDYGMILKDANAFNVQLHRGSMVFIDTLSFEQYDASKPWVAYRQFCECFLFPLLLGHYLALDIQKLLSVYLEGIPVKTAAALLPVKSRFKLSVWLHVYLQDSLSAGRMPSRQKQVNFSREKLMRLIDHLESTILPLQMNRASYSAWNNYYGGSIPGKNYLEEKGRIFRSIILGINHGRSLDLGCNDGYFSKILAEENPHVVAVDFDNQCINHLYRSIKNDSMDGIYPVCMDLCNPSPALGFGQGERQSFSERAESDLVCALALIHHLVLGKNIPLHAVAREMCRLSKKNLVIEFVPLEDEKAQQLIINKSTYHKPYDTHVFENAFLAYFAIEKCEKIPGTNRVLYLMRKK